MSRTLKIAEFHDFIGAQRREIETWIARKDQIGLRTVYADTVGGSARKFTRENVLELAGLTALVKVGLAPRHAVAFAEIIVDNDRLGRRQRKWLVFQAGDLTRAIETDSLDSAILEQTATEADFAPAISAICVGEIVRRVDQLFSPEKVEA